MCRYMIEHQLQQPEQLKAFDAAGYQFNEALSSETNAVLRDEPIYKLS